jgi:hypothetical protein
MELALLPGAELDDRHPDMTRPSETVRTCRAWVAAAASRVESVAVTTLTRQSTSVRVKRVGAMKIGVNYGCLPGPNAR